MVVGETKIVEMLRELIRRFQSIIDSPSPPDGDTIEICNVTQNLNFSAMDWDRERKELDGFYRTMGLSLDAKWAEEHYHYEFLKYAILQKIRGVRYFFGQGLESRKIIVFSEDCISSLQWFTRVSQRTNYFNIYIRSSDAIGLLGCDLLGLLYIHGAILQEHPEVNGYHTAGNVFIASCHIYQKRVQEKRIITTREGTEVKLL